jgi:DNA-binding MurR/RpiR family transcriptional regulator
VRLHEYLLKKGKRFVSITNCESSPIAEGAEAVLMAENKSLVFYNFLSNTFTLLEILLIVLSYTIKDDLMENLNKIFDAQDFFESHCLQK